MCYNTPVMEFDPFARHTPEMTPEIEWDTAEKLEKESVREKKKAEKTAQIRKLAVSEAITPSARRRKRTPELLTVQNPEAFKLEPIRSPEDKVSARRTSSVEHGKSNIDLKQLTTPELLQVAGTIALEGTTARKLFEMNQIDHRGLAAIVKAALGGENVQQAFKRHELGAEAQRGRKIEMRHDDPSHTPHVITTYDRPNERVRTLIGQLEESAEDTDGHPPLAEPVEANPDLATLSQQKAQTAIKKKRMITITISTVIGISIGATLAVLILN